MAARASPWYFCFAACMQLATMDTPPTFCDNNVHAGEDEVDSGALMQVQSRLPRVRNPSSPPLGTTPAPPLVEGTASCKGGEGEGLACIFPFYLDGVEYHNCTSYGYPGRQWCATAVDGRGAVTEGMLCAESCPQDRRTALEACMEVSMRPYPERCGSRDVNACITNECPARCAEYNTFPYPGATPVAYSAFTAFPAMNDAIYEAQWRAVQTLGAFAPGFQQTPEIFDILHSTLDYICCQDPAITYAYMETLRTFEFRWKEVGPITWDHIGCSLNSITDPSIVYLEAFVDLETNAKLLRFVTRLQNYMHGKGFEIANPRAMPFHFVISMVPVSSKTGSNESVAFNAGDAMKALSKFNFGTIYMCEFAFFGLPYFGLPKLFGGEVLRAQDYEDCPNSTKSSPLGRETRMTWRGVEIALKVNLAR